MASGPALDTGEAIPSSKNPRWGFLRSEKAYCQDLNLKMRVLNKFLSELSYLNGGYLVKPNSLFLITTFRCNLRCPACGIWRKKSFSDELNNKEWLKVADELNNFFPTDTYAEINGGEALINQELVFSLINRLKFYLVLNTNGTLINRQVVERLEKNDLDALKLSFYSLDKDIHNQMRSSEFAYDKARQVIDLVSGSKINLQAAVLITKQNISRLPELIEWLNQKGADIILQSLDEIIESKESKSAGNHLPEELWPDKNEVKKFFNWLKPRINRLKIKTPLFLVNQMENYYLNPKSVLNHRCFVGQKNLVIYPDGGVSFCFKSEKIGDLKKQSIKDILRSKEAAYRRKGIKRCQKFCRIIGCNFSRGWKEYLSIAR